MAPKVSEYELEREANIARNRALFEQLDLKEAVAQLGIPAPQPAAKTKAKPVQPTKRLKREREEEASGPRRSSARLRGAPNASVDPNETPAQRKKREALIEEERAKQAEQQIVAEEEARAAKRPRHQALDLKSLAEDSDLQNLSTLTATLESVTKTTIPRELPPQDAFVFEKESKTSAAETELREQLQGLKVVARAKVTQDRIYSSAYHPELTKDLVFFGDKHGQLGIWDARAAPDEVDDEQDESVKEGGKYWRIQLHWPATSKSSISSVKFDPIDSHTVFTSSYDCTIRELSFTSGVSREIYTSGDILITSMDIAPTGHEMFISDAQGGVTHLDTREDKNKARWYGMNDAKIGSVSINPTNPHYILTASNNRLLKIWDTRNLKLMPAGSFSDEGAPEFDHTTLTEFLETKEGATVKRGEWSHGKSASSAYWDPRGRSVVSTSYDDTIRLWEYDQAMLDSSKAFPSSRPFKNLKHNCQTGKWLTILRAQWSQNASAYPHFTIGNMNHSLDIYSGKGELLARLADPSRITAVQAVTCSHPNIVERAATGNGSGRCVLWAPKGDEEEAEEAE